jgi:hypothetical protein
MTLLEKTFEFYEVFVMKKYRYMPKKEEELEEYEKFIDEYIL